jgi:hypothetical protein
MRLFLWPLAFTIIFLIGFARIVMPIIRPPEISYTLPVHKTLYLGRGIDEEEMSHIMEAALEWNETTNGQVVLDIKMMPQPDVMPSDAVIILNVTPDYPEVIMLDNTNHYSTLAFFQGKRGIPYIGVVKSRLSNDETTEVVMHEIGHALGLEHLTGDDGFFTLMSPSVELGSAHITDIDLLYFCKLYHCNSSKFHGHP